MIPVCPKCDVGLFIVHFKDIEVDYCHCCRGLWLDAGELQALLQRTGARTDDPLLNSLDQPGTVPPGRKHLCPRCDKSLAEIQIRVPGQPELTLDRCAGHGLWFDADELQQLLAMFPAASGASHTIAFLNEIFATKQNN